MTHHLPNLHLFTFLFEFSAHSLSHASLFNLLLSLASSSSSSSFAFVFRIKGGKFSGVFYCFTKTNVSSPLLYYYSPCPRSSNALLRSFFVFWNMNHNSLSHFFLILSPSLSFPFPLKVIWQSFMHLHLPFGRCILITCSFNWPSIWISVTGFVTRKWIGT